MNIITTYTKNEEKAIKAVRNLANFYNQAVGAFVFTFDEGFDTWGCDFITKLSRFCVSVTNADTEWIFESLTDDGEIYAVYKQGR